MRRLSFLITILLGLCGLPIPSAGGVIAPGIFPDTLSENTTGAADSRFLGSPDQVDASLGLGQVTYDFGALGLINGAGPDFNVYEASAPRGAPEFDLIDVLVSEDGIAFFSVKTTEGDVVRIGGDEAFDAVDTRVIGAPDNIDLALGSRGVVYDFGAPKLLDGPGADFNIYERSDRGGPEFGAIDVLVSANGTDYFSVKGSEGAVVRIDGDGSLDAGNARVLGPPDNVDLGLGSGSVTYDLGAPSLFNGLGPDFNVYERSDVGGPEFGAIDVLVSTDGVTFVSVKDSESGVVRISGDEVLVDETFARSYDLQSVGIAAVRFVRIEGISGSGPGEQGFDLDALGLINLSDPSIDQFPNMLSENSAVEGSARSYDISSVGLTAVQFIQVAGLIGDPGAQGFDLDALGAINLLDPILDRFPTMLLENSAGASFAQSYDLSGSGLAAARFVRIAGVDEPVGGFDLDAIGAISRVHEPTPLALFSLGLAAAGYIRRRRVARESKRSAIVVPKL